MPSTRQPGSQKPLSCLGALEGVELALFLLSRSSPAPAQFSAPHCRLEPSQSPWDVAQAAPSSLVQAQTSHQALAPSAARLLVHREEPVNPSTQVSHITVCQVPGELSLTGQVTPQINIKCRELWHLPGRRACLRWAGHSNRADLSSRRLVLGDFRYFHK